METSAGRLSKKTGLSLGASMQVIQNKNEKRPKKKNSRLSGLSMQQKPGEPF